MVGLFIIIASEFNLSIITYQTPCAVSNNKSTFVLWLLLKFISRDLYHQTEKGKSSGHSPYCHPVPSVHYDTK